MKIEILKIISMKTNPKQPLFDDLENVFLYVKPGTPVLIENPFEPIVPLLVLTLDEIPDLLIFNPKPLPSFILF